jgi:hypothetical protein
VNDRGEDRMPETGACAVDNFHQRLEQLFGEPIDLRINDNTSSLMTVKYQDDGQLRLSLHRMFLTADDQTMKALAVNMRRRTAKSETVLRQFINSHMHLVRPAPHRKPVLRSRGRIYDLDALAADVNAEFFDGQVRYQITWGKGRLPRGRRSCIMFGSYSCHHRLIRIHPVLDSPDVPEFFVRFVIFHELLHASLDPGHDDKGRHARHTGEFSRREKLHPDYARATAWQNDFMKRL